MGWRTVLVGTNDRDSGLPIACEVRLRPPPLHRASLAVAPRWGRRGRRFACTDGATRLAAQRTFAALCAHASNAPLLLGAGTLEAMLSLPPSEVLPDLERRLAAQAARSSARIVLRVAARRCVASRLQRKRRQHAAAVTVQSRARAMPAKRLVAARRAERRSQEEKAAEAREAAARQAAEGARRAREAARRERPARVP